MIKNMLLMMKNIIHNWFLSIRVDIFKKDFIFVYASWWKIIIVHRVNKMEPKFIVLVITSCRIRYKI